MLFYSQMILWSSYLPNFSSESTAKIQEISKAVMVTMTHKWILLIFLVNKEDSHFLYMLYFLKVCGW